MFKKPTKSLKDISIENKKTIKFYANLLILTFVVTISVRFFYHYPNISLYIIALYLPIFIINLGALLFLNHMSKDKYTDINIPDGIAEQFKDIIIFSAVVLTTSSIVSDRLLLLYIIIPCRLFYLVWVHVISKYRSSTPQATNDQESIPQKNKKQTVKKIYR